MVGIMDVQVTIQFALTALMFIPAFYWFKMRKEIPSQDLCLIEEESDQRILVILPMRNEVKNVERKITSIISEILPHKNVFLTIADSSSNDGTSSLAEEILEVSSLEGTRWSVENFGVRGKNVALNGVIDRHEADIFVMSDADAEVSAGWLEVVRSRLSEENIGVVSGVEKENSGSSDFNSFYRRNSNWLRINESRLDSTPVLEGSILAWKKTAISPFRFDEGANADDAQIGLHSIKSGYRSIVDSRVTFKDFEDKKRTFSESVRRSQGLSIALIRNSRLAVMRQRRSARRAIFNAIVLYVFFPWYALFFVINAFIAFYNNPIIGHSWEFYSVFSVFLVSILPQGRSLIFGSAVSIIAHLQAIAGKRYKNWEPVR